MGSAGRARSPLIKELLRQDESHWHLILAQALLARSDYEAALEEDRKPLSLSANSPPGDEAQYYMALVYALRSYSRRLFSAVTSDTLYQTPIITVVCPISIILF